MKTTAKKNKISISETIGALIILIGVITMIAPFVWMVLASLKPGAEFYDASWLPSKFMWSNYTEIFNNENFNFTLYIFNSVKLTSLIIFGTLLSSSLMAYALAKIEFTGRNFVFACILLVMFLPKQVAIVPIFTITKAMGLYDTHWSLILPAFLGRPFGIMCVFLLRQFFKSVPDEYDESARIDGATQWKIFQKIYLPLVKAPLITCAIIVLQNAWGELLRPLIFLQSDELLPLVLGIKRISDSQYVPRPELELAGYMILLLPLLIIYVFAQRYFVQSISTTGVKG